MKKTLLMALGLMLVASALHAETQKSSATVTKIKGPLIEKAQGKIQTIEKADKTKGDFGGFSILADSGKAKEFKLIAKTSFYSASSAPLAFNDFKKGDKVTVLSVTTLKGDHDVIALTQDK
jgi:hypothetical protein